MTQSFLSLRGVSKEYPGHTALKDVWLEVEQAEVVVILGPSGSGKTTLLRLVAGLEVPERGEIWLAGVQVAGPDRNLVAPHRRGVGFVFQDLALWPHLTVTGNLGFVMEAQGVPKADRAARAQEVLKLVRIEGRADRYPQELSGGEQQRVALARALVGRPRVLLLDEPFSSLDPDLRGALREELGRVQRSLGLPMIYVTHDRTDAAVLADRVVTLQDGRL